MLIKKYGLKVQLGQLISIVETDKLKDRLVELGGLRFLTVDSVTFNEYINYTIVQYITGTNNLHKTDKLDGFICQLARAIRKTKKENYDLDSLYRDYELELIADNLAKINSSEMDSNEEIPEFIYKTTEDVFSLPSSLLRLPEVIKLTKLDDNNYCYKDNGNYIYLIEEY